MHAPVDVVIAGAGLSGILTLRLLSQMMPAWTFALLEKDAHVAGRLRRSAGSAHSLGLNSVSGELLEAVFTHFGPEETDGNLRFRRRSGFGVLSASKLAEIEGHDSLNSGLAKLIGGPAAARVWPEFLEQLQAMQQKNQAKHEPFSTQWTGDKKSPALAVLQELVGLWGFPELSGTSAALLSTRILDSAQGEWVGPFEELLETCLARLREEGRLQLMTSAQIMAASKEDDLWRLATTGGLVSGKRLVVAQSPWEAILWLPKDLWPSKLLNLCNKTKPVSLVILSVKRQESQVKIPETIFIPAEEVQVIADDQGLCFRATLPYELTVQAPAVVKAVKRLKRARKKLELAVPGLLLDSEHIALLPVAWAQASTPAEWKWNEKLEGSSYQKKDLSFVGDAYGAENLSDRNILQSLSALLHAFGCPVSAPETKSLDEVTEEPIMEAY